MNRRTLLVSLVSGFSALAVAGFSFPFLRSLIPSFRSEIILDVDVSELKTGEIKRVNWLGRTVYIVRRDEKRMDSADLQLIDPDSKNSSQPEYAVNAYRSRSPGLLLVFANCTHLGCEVMGNDRGGFGCPCHQSEFDFAGRVLKGGAAQTNLAIPEYRYVGSDVVRFFSRRS